MMKVTFTSILSIIFSIGVVTTSVAFPGEEDDDKKEKNGAGFHSDFNKAEKKKQDGVYFKNIANHFNSAQFDTTDRGVVWEELKLTGTVRLMSMYRNMQESYPDMVTSNRTIAFTDYPQGGQNAASTQFGGYPIVELGLSSKFSSKFSFNVGYSLAHSFTGDYDGNAGKVASSRQFLSFRGNLNTGPVIFDVQAGGILWAQISKFTMGQAIYRDSYFDRLPWDWHRNSFLTYEEYYAQSANIGAEGAGNSPVLGYVINTQIIPIGVNLRGVYGRTARNVIQANSVNFFPSITYALKAEKSILTRTVLGKAAFNFYRKEADTDRGTGTPDNVQIMTIDANLKLSKGIKVFTEFGIGKITNPNICNCPGEEITGESGFGIDFGIDVNETILPLPVSLEVYQIDVNLGSLDGSILNSNRALEDGGAANEFIWDSYQMVNVLQEVDQIANNRMGLILKTKKSFGRFKVDLALSMSQEIENLSDTITVGHRVNAWSRSRFKPWFQAGGPYNRIKSFWLRTFETLSITDGSNPDQDGDYKKGFNGIDLFLKYKTNFIGRPLVILNYSNYGSIHEGFSPIPKFNDDAFIRQFYNDLNIAYSIGKNYMIVGHVGYERVMGNGRIDVADNAGEAIEDASGTPTYDPNGNPINQTGWGFGLGLSYDFSKAAGLHIRHRYMIHTDENFTKDEFRGHETIVELKIFF